MLEYLDLTTLSWLPLLFGISFGKSGQSSSSESGLPRSQRKELGAIGIGDVKAFNPFITARTTGDLGLPSMNAMGLYPQQEQAFSQAVTQALSRFSGNYAAHGFLNPDVVASIAGSAAQQVAPQFLPLILQNILQPEQRQQERINQFHDFLKTILGVPGGSGQGSASQFNTGVLANLTTLPSGSTK